MFVLMSSANENFKIFSCLLKYDMPYVKYARGLHVFPLSIEPEQREEILYSAMSLGTSVMIPTPFL